VIRHLAAYAPLLEEIDRITIHFRAIQRIDGYDRNLSVRLLFNLLANVIQLRDRALVQHVGEVVDVVRRTEL
jgi:hypothetical protein